MEVDLVLSSDTFFKAQGSYVPSLVEVSKWTEKVRKKWLHRQTLGYFLPSRLLKNKHKQEDLVQWWQILVSKTNQTNFVTVLNFIKRTPIGKKIESSNKFWVVRATGNKNILYFGLHNVSQKRMFCLHIYIIFIIWLSKGWTMIAVDISYSFSVWGYTVYAHWHMSRHPYSCNNICYNCDFRYI